ncbi:MAG TPA: hypothetical protein VFJ60_03920 [Gaiella sp.]|nr:hypothetical protein [Gaiella sp.]
MQSPDTRTHARRRNEQRVGVLRRRAALASALGFVAFVGLAAHHAVGSTKHASTTSATPSAAAPTAYFDERAGDFAFDDAPAAASAAPLQPPVAQTNVS